MSTLNLTSVPEYGITPNVKRLRARVRVITAKIKKSKKGDKMVEVGLEFFSPEKVIDIDRKERVIAGLKTRMYVMLGGKGVAGTAQLHQKLGLPLEINKETEEEFDEAMQALYADSGLAFEAFFSTEEGQSTEYDPETGEQKPMLDDEGNPVRGGFQWGMISANDIVKKVEDPGF